MSGETTGVIKTALGALANESQAKKGKETLVLTEGTGGLACLGFIRVWIRELGDETSGDHLVGISLLP
jgi:hypothetical protein